VTTLQAHPALCRHPSPIEVEISTGEVVALLCPLCDAQLEPASAKTKSLPPAAGPQSYEAQIALLGVVLCDICGNPKGFHATGDHPFARPTPKDA
jgi:hypothetical protein